MELNITAAKEYSLKPSLRPRNMHSHNTYEIYMFLTGDVDFQVEGSHFHLDSGDLVLVRKGEVHMARIVSAASYERMHINFDLSEQSEFKDLLSPFNDRPLGHFNHYSASLFPQNHWKEYIEEICNSDNKLRQFCHLLPLLSDLKEAQNIVRAVPNVEGRDLVSEIVRFINQNLTMSLSLEILSEQFYLSKTHLNRLFRQSMGTTLWEYITLKRLYAAKEMLDHEHRPTEIFADCGFRDYTTFFRAYKKHFGISPSSHMKVSHKATDDA